MRTMQNSNRTFAQFDKLFLDSELLDLLLKQEGTPLCVYSEKGLRETAKSLFDLFASEKNVSMLVPVHLCHSKALLSILAHQGLGAYCQSQAELDLALDSGFSGDRIVYAALVLPETTAQRLQKLDATLLAADPEILTGPLPRRVDLACSLRRSKQKGIVSSEYHRAHIGLTREEVWQYAPKLAAQNKEIGLSLIEGTNVTDVTYLAKKTEKLLQYAEEVSQATGVKIHRICPGEGPGFLYERSVATMDFAASAKNFSQAIREYDVAVSLNMGRCLLEPCGILISTVLNILQRGRPTLIVDASTEMLRVEPLARVRHSSIVGKEWIEGRKVCDVIGCLPTTRDWFAERCILPVAEIGDRVVFHDVGCTMHPFADTVNYLCREDGSLQKLEHGKK